MLRTRTLASVAALGIGLSFCATGVVLASEDPSATADPGSMSDLSKSEGEAFQAKAAEVAKAFAESEPPATYVDPDPASTVNPHPELDAVEQLVAKTAPGAFAGAYEDERGVVHVGLTGAAGLAVGTLRAALPNVDLVVFNARYSWSELVATTDEITELMSSQPALIILSAGPDVKQNVVTVGVTDVEAPSAKALAAQYGDLVSIFQDDPLELRADAVAPGRDRFRNPVLGGLNITSPGRSCTSGFDYGPPIRQDPTGTGEEQGVITAGHCLVGQVPTQTWFQGGRILGPFTRHRYVNLSTADAGTISTTFSLIRFRRVTNAVFLTQGALAQRITSRLARGAGRTGDILLVSGARSGLSSGSVVTGGAGRSHTSTRGGRIVTIQNVYSANVSNPIVNGDSGAPVFNGTGVAFGIVLGSARANQRRMFYSQIANVESQLGVTTCTGRPSPQC